MAEIALGHQRLPLGKLALGRHTRNSVKVFLRDPVQCGKRLNPAPVHPAILRPRGRGLVKILWPQGFG
jgi:hypothetical protein